MSLLSILRNCDVSAGASEVTCRRLLLANTREREGFCMRLARVTKVLLDTDMAVAQKTGIPKWVALVSGNMDQNLRFAPPV